MASGTGGRERGSLTVEYACLLVVVAALVVALLTLPIGGTVGAWIGYATCLVTGGECRRPGEPASSAAPDRCRRGVSTVTVDGHVGVVLEGRELEGYELVERSDGTVAVTYLGEQEGGLAISAGTYGRIDLGHHGGSLGASAGAGRFLSAGNGTTWTFADRADAEAWTAWHQAIGVARDRFDTPWWTRIDKPHLWGGRDSVAAHVADRSARAVNEVQRWFGGDVEVPPEPDRTQTFVSGGWSHEAIARAGVGPGEASAALHGATRLGQLTDTDTGETTLLWGTEQLLAVDAAILGADRHGGGLGVDGHVAVTLDADGYATRLEVVTTVPGEPGLDPTALDDPREVLGTPWHATSGPHSLYEVTLSLPLDGRDLVSVLRDIGPGAVTTLLSGGRSGSLADELWARGAVGIVEHDLRIQRYGGELSVTVGPAPVALGGGSVHTDRTATNAHYLDHPDLGGTRAWTRWTSCVAD